jgi:outer membrane protein assembly factor BamB
VPMVLGALVSAVVLVAAVVGVVLLNGDSGDDPTGDEIATGSGESGSGESDAGGAPRARFAWQFALDEDTTGDTVGLDEERVYMADDQGNLTAIDLASGTEAWSVPLGEDAGGTQPVRVGGVLLMGIGTPSSTFALDPATGSQVWKAPDVWMDPPLVVGDLVIGHAGSTVTALDLATGAVRWELEDMPWTLTPPASVGGVVVLASDDGRVTGIDPASGTTRWVLPLERGDVDVDAIGVAGDAAIVVDEDQHVTAIDAATGQQRWTRDLEADAFDTPTMIGEHLVVSVEEGLLLVDPATGETRRSLPILAAGFAPLPGPVPGIVTYDVLSVQAFDLEGRSLWSEDVPFDGLIMTVGPTALTVHDYEGNLATFTLT